MRIMSNSMTYILIPILVLVIISGQCQQAQATSSSFTYQAKDTAITSNPSQRSSSSSPEILDRPKRDDTSSEFQTSSKTSCLYTDISRKIDMCFINSVNCSQVLECISQSRLSELCGHFDMYTPSIWVLNVFEILHAKDFCENKQLGCPLGWGTSKNESLAKLNDIMKAIHEYGSEFLDMPRTQSKAYCSKSLSLVTNVKEVFDQMDQCSVSEALSSILNEITESSKNILNKNCPYCIAANNFFDGCLNDYWGNEHNCSTTLNCIYNKIELYGCNEDEEETTLTLVSSFLNNVSSVCDMSAVEKNKTQSTTTAVQVIQPWVAIEWFREVEYCLQGKQFLGLTYAQAPKGTNICQSMEEIFKCLHQTLNDFRFLDQPLFRTKFAYFANRFNRMQRTCDMLSIQHVVEAKKQQEKALAEGLASGGPRHSFQINAEQHVFEENKKYYHQSIIWPRKKQIVNWIEVDAPEFQPYHVQNDRDLSQNYLKATVVSLKFSFPFYGHLLDRLIIATGGFIYVGETMNSLITKTQYIAPLMGNFNPALNQRAAIKYVDNTTHFICTWENMLLKDQPQNGEYTFQVVLSNTGDITFNYKSVPSNVMISDSNHEVKLGLSDGYTANKGQSDARVVPYHKIDISLDNVRTGNSIMFFMLKNCIQLDSCGACVEGVENFQCIWCPTIQRCSDTLDRYRQEWIISGCPIERSGQNQTCQDWLNPRFNHYLYNQQQNSKLMAIDGSEYMINYSDYVKAIVIGVFSTLCISLVLISSAWMYYAYTNPTSPSGIWLIEHRPSKVIPMLSFNFNRNAGHGSGLTRFENVE